MPTFRIIPRLDVKECRVVKGIQMEGLRPVGDPKALAEVYYQQGADELLYIDITASLYDKKPDFDAFQSVADSVFVPITFGGGIRTLGDVRTALRSGADRVAINTAAVKDPKFVQLATEEFGSSTIVGMIETMNLPSGGYGVFTNAGREESGIEAGAWAERLEGLGVGEILLSSIDRDGTGSGFDISIINEIQTRISIPLVVHGGAGRIEDIVDIANTSGVSGVAVASMLHYSRIKDDANRRFSLHKTPSKISTTSVTEIKDCLKRRSIEVR